jgi:glycerol kinase
MSRDLILAIDQGTTNTKALLFDARAVTAGAPVEAAVLAEAAVRVPVAFPRPGWVETDPEALWQTVGTAVERCLAGVEAGSLAAVAVANQRESVLAWDRRTGRALGPCVSWQCRRSGPLCERLAGDGAGPLIQARTGLTLDPMFSAGKARWLLDHIDAGEARARRGEICLGTVDAWLAWNLSGGTVFATDLTNASRTQLLDLDALRWDEELMALFGVPAAALPELRASSAVVGATQGAGALRAGIPIAALVGDSHAALFGHGAPAPGSAKATYGTGTSVMAPLERPTRDARLSSTVAWSLEEPGRPGAVSVAYALEGNITATGAALGWLATILGLEGQEAELERLALSVPDAEGVYLVPAFTGLGAPHWDAAAQGLISGLGRGTSRAHLARAAFDAVAYQVRDVLDVLRACLPTPLVTLYADGGAVQSDLLAQTQADVLGLPVLRSRSGSLAALGAAYLAGLATGILGSLDEVRRLPRDLDRFEPGAAAPGFEDGYRGWQLALRRASGALADTPAAGGSPSEPVPAGAGS